MGIVEYQKKFFRQHGARPVRMEHFQHFSLLEFLPLPRARLKFWLNGNLYGKASHLAIQHV